MMTVPGSVLGDLMDPATTAGALVYAVAFLLAASLLSRALGIAVKQTLAHDDSVQVERTAALN